MSHIWETSLIGLYNSHKSNENDWGDWAVRKLNKINDSDVSQFSAYNEVSGLEHKFTFTYEYAKIKI